MNELSSTILTQPQAVSRAGIMLVIRSQPVTRIKLLLPVHTLKNIGNPPLNAQALPKRANYSRGRAAARLQHGVTGALDRTVEAHVHLRRFRGTPSLYGLKSYTA